jgi:hypothetical protein
MDLFHLVDMVLAAIGFGFGFIESCC